MERNLHCLEEMIGRNIAIKGISGVGPDGCKENGTERF